MARSFGSRTTAEEALDGVSLDGKTAIVTGANSGIGVETARVLALAGARVVMACRSRASAEKVAAELRPRIGKGSLEVESLDLGDLASVRSFAERYVASERPLHLLVNNAGIMGTQGLTAQGHELQLGTNHLGHFLLTVLLRPVLERSAPARIVNVSSALHERGRTDRLFLTLEDPRFERHSYDGLTPYYDSKLANVLFTRQLAKDLPPSVCAFAIHPGVIITNLIRSMGFIGAVYGAVGRLFTKSVLQGAATTVFAATSPSLEGQSGAYLADCAIKPSSRASLDEDAASRLWGVSERLVADFAAPVAA